jgi:hypothetical protein
MIGITAFGAADRHALLIGCSKYPIGKHRELIGTENDVEGFRRVLIESFDFKEITTLAGWSEDSATRPTAANICAAFEQLVTKAQIDDQVVILMSGHGFRFPLPESQVDPLDPANPESDGLDEAFLAADYHAGQNMILDDQIGRWLTQLKAKGAHVWIIFDSCYSGTMTRGGIADSSRELSPSEAGISLDAIGAAQRRAAQVATKADLPMESEGLDIGRADDALSGSVVAFYAAQDFETAPEVTRPKEADENDPRFKRGLLSFHLEHLLRDRTSRITYGDLGRAVLLRYRADGRRWPTPFWDGDLDREVLGLREWPRREPIQLDRVGDEYRLTGGELAGLSKDVVVALHHPDDKDRERPLAYFRVTASNATSASAEPFAYGDAPVPTVDSLPENCVCHIARGNFSDVRVSLRLVKYGEPGLVPLDDSYAATIRTEAESEESAYDVTDGEKAEWSLVALSPTAADELGAGRPGRALFLVPASNANALFADNSADLQSARRALQDVPHLFFNEPLMERPDDLVKELTIEVRKIIAWNNMWRLAKAYAEPSPLVSKQDIFLSVSKLDGPLDTSQGTPLDASRLVPGDSVAVRVLNKGYQPYWFAAFLLDGRFGITHVTTDAIQGRDYRNIQATSTSREVLRFDINPQSSGTNGFVLIAVSQKEHPSKPDYRFLGQPILGAATTRAATSPLDLESPFEQVLLASLGDQTRKFRSSASPDNPQIACWSWVTAPLASSP